MSPGLATACSSGGPDMSGLVVWPGVGFVVGPGVGLVVGFGLAAGGGGFVDADLAWFWCEFSPVEPWRVAPEGFEVVVGAGVWFEEVDDDMDEVCEEPGVALIC